jgi:hypothetical protein
MGRVAGSMLGARVEKSRGPGTGEGIRDEVRKSDIVEITVSSSNFALTNI